jgi:hypothetical protein
MNLVNLNDKSQVEAFLKSPTEAVAALLTGILSSESTDYKLSAGRLIQAFVKNKFLQQLGVEINEYVKKGAIKEDFLKEPNDQSSFLELLNFIDNDNPDEVKFKAMKSLFFCSVSKVQEGSEGFLNYELMRICRLLSSGEILVLKSAYEINFCKNPSQSILSMRGINLGSTSVSDWFEMVSRQLEHNVPALVEIYEEKLITLKLISPRITTDNRVFEQTGQYRLTPLGFRLCEHILRY